MEELNMAQDEIRSFIARYRFMPDDIQAGFTALARGQTLPPLTLERLRRYRDERGQQHVLNAVKEIRAADLKKLEVP